MVVRSIVLFIHVLGMLLLFAGVGRELARVESRRLFGIGSGLILLSGSFLAWSEGLLTFAWVRVSFAAMLVMAIASAPPIRSRARVLSLRVRTALGLGAVFLMISKPGTAGSLSVIGLALLAGIAAGSFGRDRSDSSTLHTASGVTAW